MMFNFHRPSSPVAPQAHSGHVRQVKHRELPRSALVGLFAFAWMLVRVPLFLVLYWLRLPVMVICNAVSIPALFAFLFSCYAFPDKTRMIVALAAASLSAFVVLWLYDYVLMLLSPQELSKTL